MLAVIAGRRALPAFAKAMLLPQSVAISTRSSLASIPAMLVAARRLGVRERIADVTFPMIGALFRPTGPAMNIAVAFYVAHWLGLDPSAEPHADSSGAHRHGRHTAAHARPADRSPLDTREEGWR